MRLSKSWPGERPRTGIEANIGVADSAGFADAREVVGPGRRQDADQELQVVAVRPELARQLVEQAAQLGTGFAVEVIDRFDQADSEEASPDAVDDRLWRNTGCRAR